MSNNKQSSVDELCNSFYEESIDESNIPREHYEYEIKQLMIEFALYYKQTYKKDMMTNDKQSSVEWLLSFIEPSLTPEQKHFFSMVIEQAKAMHKEEIMDAFQSGKWDWADNVKHGLETKDPAEYYNETFGGNK